MSLSVSLQRARGLVLGDLIARGQGRAVQIARDALLVIGAAGFVGALAQISMHLSFTPVPITGQTLGVLLAGTVLGWRRAVLSMGLYALAGVAGVPWFAGHSSGYVGASFGYMLGFIFAATICGFLAERGADRAVHGCVPVMFAAEIVIYLFGVTWLAIDMHLSAGSALHYGLTPFLIGDAIKAAIAAGLLPVMWKLAGRRPGPPHSPVASPQV